MDLSKKMVMNIFQAIFCICLAIFIIYLTLTQFTIDEYSMGGTFASHSFYPQLIAGVMIFLSILLILTSLFGKKEQEDIDSKAKVGPTRVQAKKNQSPNEESFSKPRLFGVALLLILYTVSLDLFGYILTSPIFMAALFILLQIRKWAMVALLAIVSSGLIYVLFSMVLEVVFPIGRYPLIGS